MTGIKTRLYPTMTVRLPDSTALIPYLRQIDAQGRYSNFGPLATTLSQRLCARFAAPDGVCLVANATAGLVSSLQDIAEIKPGGICLLPSWTFAASVHAVLLSGLQPRFVDVDAEWGDLTPGLAARALQADVAAVMPVSVFGRPVDPVPWKAFRASTGLDIVLDAAAAFDSVVPADFPTVVSMHATKPVSSAEGGFILATDSALVERLSRRSNFGFDANRQAQFFGGNAKLSEYHAAVAHASLDQWADRRRELMNAGKIYKARLADLPVALQPGWAETWISTTLNLRLAKPADLPRLYADLKTMGIEARSWWSSGCHTQPAFRRFANTSLAGTEAIARCTVGLPFSSHLTAGDIDYIADRLSRALASQ